MEEIFSQSSFSRTNYNYLKAGAYFTPPAMMKRIANLFAFAGKTAVLEPSCGDLSALLTFLEGIDGGLAAAEVYAAELNTDTAVTAKENAEKYGVKNVILNTDFIKGMSNSLYFAPLCVSNPPYGETVEGDRQETIFMKKTYQMMAKGGIYVLIIPSYTLANWKEFLKDYLVRFELVSVYKFDEEFYDQFKQVVVIGRRRKSIDTDMQSFVLEGKQSPVDRYSAQIKQCTDLEHMLYLPTEPLQQKLIIPKTDVRFIRFATKEFNADAAAMSLPTSPAYRFFSQKTRQSKYRAMKVGKPVTELSPSFIYLAASCGVRQGVVGSQGHEHIVRGYCKVNERAESRTGADGKPETVIVHSNRVEMHILDGTGKYSILQ